MYIHTLLFVPVDEAGTLDFADNAALVLMIVINKTMGKYNASPT